MAENSKLTGIELNGVLYTLGKSVYEELELSLVRFAELLGRDFYCPTLTEAPTASTLMYVDTDGEEQTFQIGQPCRWQEDGGWRLALLKDNAGGAATWYVLPTKLSELPNDAGFLTQHQDISHLATKTEVNNKVDKISGKGLSTEDFTTALKDKLNGLNNYDDASITAAVNKLRTDLDTLVSGDTTTAIKSFNDIIAFLDGITDSEDLDSIIASIEQQIAGKMDNVNLASVATSGSYNDLKDKPSLDSINGVLSIEKGGTGAVTAEDVRSNLSVYSKEEVDNLLLDNGIELPSGYTQVEYIESTGSQYIDTGFIPNQDTRLVMEAQFREIPTNYAAVFGSRNGDALGFWLYYRPAQSMFAYRYGNSSTNFFVNADPLQRNHFDANKNVMTIGGNSVTATAETFEGSSPIYLFAVNATGSVGYTSSLTLYSCKIYDNGTIVRNFIPCINPSGKAGLYDVLNGIFYENKGNNDFLTGSAVLKDVTPVEKGGTGAVNAEDARRNLGITPTNIGAPTIEEMNTVVSRKQDKSIKFTNLSADTWVSDSTYPEFPWRCDVTCEGVTGDMYADVVFGLSQSMSGNYAPLCETKSNVVSIWSNENISITIPTILITR